MAEEPNEDRRTAPPPPPDSTLLMGGRERRVSPGRPAPESLAEGTRLLDRYIVRGLLGRGAFGEVYAVADLTTETEYALKRIPPDVFRADQSISIRGNFQLVSTLTHPHIATTRFLETDPKSGELYVIMDLVRGPTLSEWLEQRREKKQPAALPHDVALGICEQVATALDYAHEQPVRDRHGEVKSIGILHRDLKPSNIMLEVDRPFRPGVPFAKVVDFGLAAEIQASVQGLSLSDPRQEMGGTPVYMAPEQWEGRTLTPAMDQWSLAVVLYELLAGDRPFRASSVQALAIQIREARPEKPPHVSDGQWTVLKRAFSSDRKQRYGNCMTMVRAFALADTATSEMLRTKPFVRMVSMRTDSSSAAQEAPVAVAGPATGLPVEAGDARGGWTTGKVALVVAVLGMLFGVVLFVILVLNAEPPDIELPDRKVIPAPPETRTVEDGPKKEPAPPPPTKAQEPEKAPAAVPAVATVRHGVHPIPWTSNQGVSLTLQILDPDASEIFYRTGHAGEFKSTGHQLAINPRTLKPLPQMMINLPHTTERVELEVTYTDGQGQRQGPFTVVYDPQAAQVAEVKQILQLTKWVEFREWDEEKDFVYFTHLVSHRRGLSAVKFSIDSEALDQVLPLKPVDPKEPYSIPDGQMTYVGVPKATKYVCVQVVYRDGSTSEARKFTR